MKVPYTCGAMIKYIHSVLDKKANNELRAKGLTFSQITALVLLSLSPQKQLALKDLKRDLHIAQPTATGIVRRLEQKKYVEIRADETDGRIKLIHITKAGERQSQRAHFLMQQAEAWLRSPLTDEEAKTFLVLLKKVCDGVSKDE